MAMISLFIYVVCYGGDAGVTDSRIEPALTQSVNCGRVPLPRMTAKRMAPRGSHRRSR